MCTPTEWIKKSVNVCIHISSYGQKQLRDEWMWLEQEYQKADVVWKSQVKRIFLQQFEPKDLLYVFSVFIRYMKLEDLSGIVFSAVSKADLNCFTGSMLEYNINCIVKGHYAEKRKLHKRNLDLFEGLLGIENHYQPLSSRNKKRIVIITEQILSLLHAPTKIVVSYAYVLQKYLGYEVMLFACTSDAVLPEELWYQGNIANSQEMFEKYPLIMKYQDVFLRGYQINMASYSIKEYSMMLSMIHAWNPLFVFCIGQTIPVADLAGKFTTVVAQHTTVETPISEAGFFVHFAGTPDMEEDLQSIGSSQTPIELDKITLTFDGGNAALSREEMGLPANRFFVAVVGNRLAQDVDEKFVNVMKKILEDNPVIDFAIIGEPMEIKKQLLDTIFEGRIYYLGYCKDLVSTYRNMDLYLNPDRQGGGFSSLMALTAGLPVVTLPGRDVACNVGEEFVVPDYNAMIQRVLEYSRDDAFYAAMRELALEKSKKYSEGAMVKSIGNMMNEIITAIEKKELQQEEAP